MLMEIFYTDVMCQTTYINESALAWVFLHIKSVRKMICFNDEAIKELFNWVSNY